MSDLPYATLEGASADTQGGELVADSAQARIAAALPDLSAALLEARTLSLASELMFPHLRRHMGACRMVLASSARRTGHRVQVHGEQPSPIDTSRLHRDNLDLQTVVGPFSLLADTQPLGRVFRARELAAANDSRLRWLHTVMQRWLDIDGNMSINLTDEARCGLRLTVFDNDPRFGVVEREFLEGIAPMIRFGLHNLMLREQADHAMAGLDASTALRDVVTVLLYEDQSLAWASNDYRARLQACFGAFNGPLPAPVLDWLKKTGLVPARGPQSVRPFEYIFFTPHDAVRARAAGIKAGPQRNGVLVELTPARRTQRRARLRARGLTPREVDVALLLPQGLTHARVAAQLGIREVTVKKHLRSIGAKLGAVGKLEILGRLTALLSHPDWPQSVRF